MKPENEAIALARKAKQRETMEVMRKKDNEKECV